MSEHSPFEGLGDLKPRHGSFSTRNRSSWKELQIAVKQAKSVQQSLINRVPHSFTFCENKLYFLAVPFGSRENSIHYVDLPSSENGSRDEQSVDFIPLAWKPLLDSFRISRSFSGYSREEQLLRERKRLGAFGITSYDFDETCRRFMFSASSSLYTCTDWRMDEEDENRQPIVPEELPSQTTETKMDPKLCPCDPNLVAFVHCNDVWVNNIITEEERRLTYTNQGSASHTEEPISAGVASFIVQEEFDRYTGYWWQPKFNTDESLTRTYKILFEEVDESAVEVLHIVSGPDGIARNSHVDSYRYPKAGSVNAKSKLKIVEFSIDTSGKISDHVIEYQMRVPLSEAFPFMEYLVRCGWLPDGESVYAEILDRNQQHLALVQIPVAFFVPVNHPANQLLTITEGSPMIEVLAEESNDIWINVSKTLFNTFFDLYVPLFGMDNNKLRSFLPGHQVYGMIFKPPNIEPGFKYPTVLFLYGGPHVQLVTNAHKGFRFLRLHTIAKLGYVVVIMDCRGSAHRGLQFEGHLKNRLGQVEIEEQVEGLQYVAKATDFIDLSRVAIHGWSYGGYLSLLGLVQRPDVFKVAIVGAPVTTWEAYDTGYTERYMNTPAENPRGYKMSSVLNYANRFPDEENRLLIVHGLIDENVHFYHSSLLIGELIKACKPYQLLIYPNERHGIRQSVSSEHYETMLLSFLQKNL
ncbi:PREDICTED: dipeptidyl peptidase 9-like [Acropora digitifera]|uniref:dipeptidyl peptidase 9-like n=1 Tax=Acropora digitifera TaxID=70779 RepID=UPI00077B1D5C|nr:PREDICTED: dipeptidyl peptidase 9-like [Acropora digitifera]